MNHTTIAANVTAFQPSQKYLAENHSNISLYLGEVNSLVKNLGLDQYESVFGAALWLCDFMLFAMSQSLSRVYLQQGTLFGYASWIPVVVNGIDPEVRAPYYGSLFVADAMGGTERLQVKNIDLESDTLSAYGFTPEALSPSTPLSTCKNTIQPRALHVLRN